MPKVIPRTKGTEKLDRVLKYLASCTRERDGGKRDEKAVELIWRVAMLHIEDTTQ